MKLQKSKVATGAFALLVCVTGFLAFYSGPEVPEDLGDGRMIPDENLPRSQQTTRQKREAHSDPGSSFGKLDPQVPEPIRFNAFEDGFSLKPEAIAFLKLNDTQVSAINEATSRLVDRIKDYEANNAQIIKEEGFTSFVFIPASGELGKTAWTDFQNDVRGITGDEKAEFLLSNSKHIFNIYTGYRGELPKLVEVRPTTSSEGGFKFYIREMVLRQSSAPLDFANSDALYDSGGVANQRSELFDSIPERYSPYVTKEQ